MSRRKVPDFYMDAFAYAKERGQDDDSAAWFAEMQLQHMAETPELPKENEDAD